MKLRTKNVIKSVCFFEKFNKLATFLTRFTKKKIKNKRIKI